MNKRRSTLFLFTAAVIVVIFIIWIAGGSEVFTKTQVLVDKTSELDKMLGVKNEVWEDKFIFGLLPSAMALNLEFVSVATLSALVLIISAILFFKLKSGKIQEIK